jgi:predicted dehydrogenase
LDLGIYPISFAYMVLGKPSSIVAQGEFTTSGVDSQTSMIFRYPNGAHAQLTTTLLLKSPCTAQIIGTEASLFIDGDFYTPTSMRLKRVSGDVIEFPRVYQGHGLREQAIEFAKLVSEGKKESDLMTHADTQSIMETMDEIRSQIGLRYPFED